MKGDQLKRVTIVAVALLAMLLGLVACGEKASVYPGATWESATSPEQFGWSSEKLTAAQKYSEKIGSVAVMIVDDGIVIDAWGDFTRNYMCHSMRKSLISALYGIYVADGKIDISKTLKELGIDDYTPLTEEEKQATVTDLLKARSGVYIPAADKSSGMKTLRPERGCHLPGTFWYYNNWDFNTLGTIFDQETGEKNIYQAFKTRIADPIGMQDINIENLQYEYESYSKHPYYGFRMSTRALLASVSCFCMKASGRTSKLSLLIGFKKAPPATPILVLIVATTTCGNQMTVATAICGGLESRMGYFPTSR